MRTTKKYAQLFKKKKIKGAKMGKDGRLIIETVTDQFGKVVRKSRRGSSPSSSDDGSYSSSDDRNEDDDDES